MSASPPSPSASPEDVMRLAGGKMLSALFELAVRRDLFAHLAGRQVPLEELPEVWGLPASSARFLAQFLANVGLLVYRDGAVSNGPLAEAALARESPLRQTLPMGFRYDLSADELEAHLLDPPVSQWYQLRDQGGIQDSRAILRQPTGDAWFHNLAERRHEWRVERGLALGELYDFTSHRHLLDVGASSGGHCLGLVRRYPHLRCVAFDLPETIEVARAKVAEAGENERVETVAGSFFDGPLPTGFDVVHLSQILHNWTPDDGRLILDKVYAALDPGGVILVHETFFADDWSGSIEAVLNGFVMIGADGACGWQPCYADVEALLGDVGFVAMERRPDLVIARKPEAA